MTLDVARIRAVVLDIGNVVIDIDFDEVFSVWAEHSETGATTIRSRFSMDANYQAHERGEIDAERFHAGLREALALELSWDGFVAGWEAMILGPMPGIEAVTDAIAQRWTLAWFSNTNELHRSQFESAFAEVLAPFDFGFASSSLGARKPEAASYQAVTERLDLAPGAIAFFDDNAANVEAAQAFGWQAERVDSPAQIARALGLGLESSTTG